MGLRRARLGETPRGPSFTPQVRHTPLGLPQGGAQAGDRKETQDILEGVLSGHTLPLGAAQVCSVCFCL